MSTKGLSLQIGQSSDVGPTRQSNEDAVAISIPEDDALRHSKGSIFLVADGMGGHQAGEVASQMAVVQVEAEYYAGESGDVGASLLQAFETTNQKLHELAEADPAKQGMGTTLVAAVILGRELVVANVGDSRAYLLRRRRLAQITADHSWVEEQIRAGLLTRKQADNHPHRNLITRALGIRPSVEVDLFAETLKPEDVLLLCTDGLNAVPGREIVRIVDSLPPAEAAVELVAKAAALSGKDNASVVIVQVGSEALRTRPAPGGVARRRWALAAVGGMLLLALATAVIVAGLGRNGSQQVPFVQESVDRLGLWRDTWVCAAGAGREPAGVPQLGPVHYPELTERELGTVAQELGYGTPEQIRREPTTDRLEVEQGVDLWPAEPAVLIAGVVRQWRCQDTCCTFELTMPGESLQVRCEMCLLPESYEKTPASPSTPFADQPSSQALDDSSPQIPLGLGPAPSLEGKRVRVFGDQPEQGAVVLAQMIDQEAPWWSRWRHPWVTVYQATGYGRSGPAWVYSVPGEIPCSTVEGQYSLDLQPGTPVLVYGRWSGNMALEGQRLYRWDGTHYVTLAALAMPSN